MPRRKRKNNGVLGLAAILLIAWLALRFVSDNLALVLELIFAIGIIGALAYLGIFLLRNRERRRTMEIVGSRIDRHMENLCRSRAQLVRDDPYGKPLLDKWHQHIDYFTTEHIRPALSAKQQAIVDAAEIRGMINQRVDAFIQHNPVLTVFSDSMTPLKFEAFCADQLRMNSWTAQLTRASGDQGVDVLAEKNGVRVVLQCKLYSGPVGNKAVQEIVAGRAFEQADYGVVVSNRGYTPAAEQLAAVTDVRLLHYSDLPRLEKLLGLETGGSSARLEGFPSSGPTQIAFDSPAETRIDESTRWQAHPIHDQSEPASRRKLWVIASVAALLIAVATVTLIPRPKGLRAVMIHGRYNGPVATGYTRYSNERLGYSIDFPTFFVRRVALNEGGMELISPDGTASLIMAAAKNERRRTTKEFYNEAIASGSGTLGYHVLGGSWFVVTWENGDELVYEKMFVGSGSHDWFMFTFPADQRHIYEPIVTAVEKSFKPGTINQTW